MKAKRRIKISAIPVYAIVILLAVILILPFLNLVSTSFKTFEDAITNPNNLIPSAFVVENYFKVVSEHGYLRALANSLLLSVVPAIGTVLSSSVVAYAFSRFEVKEREAIFSFLMMSVMIPGQVLQISMYALYVELNWVDTYLPLLIPPFLGGGIMNVFLIRQFFRGIPKSLFEAAEIDGAGEVRIFATIALRLSTPVLIMVWLTTFVGAWNDFMTPLLYLGGKESLQPLALTMYNLFDRTKIGDTKQWNIISAANVLTLLPIIGLFFASQKYFIEGISLAGIKQ